MDSLSNPLPIGTNVSLFLGTRQVGEIIKSTQDKHTYRYDILYPNGMVVKNALHCYIIVVSLPIGTPVTWTDGRANVGTVIAYDPIDGYTLRSEDGLTTVIKVPRHRIGLREVENG